MRSSQAGFVTLSAIIIMVVVTLVGTLLYTSLLGELQGEIGARQSVAALGVAEAGANWAGNKLGGLEARPMRATRTRHRIPPVGPRWACSTCL
jgi:hypothetical protein